MGDGDGDGDGDGLGDGLGEGLGDGSGEGDGDGLGEGLVDGSGEGDGDGLGDGLGDGSGCGPGSRSSKELTTRFSKESRFQSDFLLNRRFSHCAQRPKYFIQVQDLCDALAIKGSDDEVLRYKSNSRYQRRSKISFPLILMRTKLCWFFL